jgi:hypothetical protein
MTETTHSLGHVLIPLLRGVVYGDQHPATWQALLQLLPQVRDYLAVLGLSVHLDESEGFAFLRQLPAAEDDPSPLPRLLARRPLSYPQSLLCLALRRRLLEHDLGDASPRLVVEREAMTRELKTFLPAEVNDARLDDQLARAFSRLAEYGFVRELDPGRFEVRRVLKALIDAERLERFDSLIAAYAEKLA